MGESCLSQTRRTIEKGVVQRLPSHLCRLDINLQVGNDFTLSGKIFQLLRSDNSF